MKSIVAEATLVVDGGPLDGTHRVTLCDDPTGILAGANPAFGIYNLLDQKPPGSTVISMSPHTLETVRTLGLKGLQEQKHHAHIYQLVSHSADATNGNTTMAVKYVGPN